MGELETRYSPPLIKASRPDTAKRAVSRARVSSLFTPDDIQFQSTDFDFRKSPDALLKAKNQQLFAVRTQITQGIKMPAKVPRPITALNVTPPRQTMLTKKPLSPLPHFDYSGTQKLKEEIENDRRSLSFQEEPLAYFSKRKDGRGHTFLYLNNTRDRNDPLFSPYDIVKVPAAERKPDYYTMSAKGVTHIFPDRFTEHLSLDQWSQDAAAFAAIRKLKIFGFYLYWKPLGTWRSYVINRRYRQLSSCVRSVSFFTNDSFFRLGVEIFGKSCDAIIQEFLICFQAQKKFLMPGFHALVAANKETLIDRFRSFMDSVTELEIGRAHV
jgi:hypothetical protein